MASLNRVTHLDQEGLIILAGQGGYDVIRIEDVLYIESDNIYIKICLVGGIIKYAFVAIGKLCKALANDNFLIRIHNRYIINVAHIERIMLADGGSIKMRNACSLPLARSKRMLLISRLRMKSNKSES